LNTNQISRRLVPLERLFDSNNIPLKPSIQPEIAKVEDYNMGIDEEAKMVKLSNILSQDEKREYI